MSESVGGDGGGAAFATESWDVSDVGSTDDGG
jgi:hypothetical protein